MTAVLVFMTVIVLVAVLALGYAAFPHRGAPVPGAPWLTGALERAADAVPTVADGDLDRDTDLTTRTATDTVADPAIDADRRGVVDPVAGVETSRR